VRFLVDAYLSPRLAVSLTEAGHDAVHVADLGMSRATDLEILDVADREDRVVVSADTDFGTLLAMGNRRRPSVLLLRLASPRRAEHVTAVLHLNLPAVLDALDAGSVLVVEDARIRIRSLPMNWSESKG
jgi:predicted nuclease of predicted toxin-antitoxin system